MSLIALSDPLESMDIELKSGEYTVVFGFKIYSNRHLRIQHRKPRSKKSRIRKKWANDPNNWKPDPRVYAFDDKMICHPSTISRLEENFIKGNRLNIKPL
jgi:hypothetical protein